MSEHWKGFNKSELQEMTSSRKGESKTGDELLFFDPNNHTFDQFLSTSAAPFVLIGIKECTGPVANYGNKGAQNGFEAFLKSFVNVQVNRFFNPKDVVLGGYFEFPFENKSIQEHKDDVAIIDYQVFLIMEKVFQHGKIPIVIGGGHNNAYPIIKGWYSIKKKKINVLNIDPHADFRELEGRHSGNSFSYAKDEGMIDQYSVYGLHESYNNESMLAKMEASEGVSWLSFEKIIHDDHPIHLFLRYIERLQRHPTGLEIDLDAIAYIPVSAFTPSGFTVEQIRQYIAKAVGKLTLKYLHISEGAPNTEKEEKIIGKTIAFMVVDFIKRYK